MKRTERTNQGEGRINTGRGMGADATAVPELPYVKDGIGSQC